MNDDETYDAAKKHPVASVILEALHDQDARTYNGRTGNMGALALAAAEAAEKVIRPDERRRVAELLEENAATIVGFINEPTKAVDLIAFLLRLNGGQSDGSRAAADAPIGPESDGRPQA